MGSSWAMFRLRRGWQTKYLKQNQPERKIADNTTITNYQCDVKEERVTSEKNPADDLSRGDNSNEDLRKQVRIDLPPDLVGLIEQV
ncbi:uncharacterized protein MELLADRAFT_57202 [Melampsora larici-populina 98AG31]|uniref:Uncharacterized protein n=1 Tax=Melampsora larici-populina (strain 98AG31 / pathotype 3-4-7) TaxID=747676 RepID=F4RZL5_MELLP|nr:uncharacterized protein MELLADRAFT_57202 [Melampsora larici-populina 98AG31]EGG02024.1 hypothetical protein MELLADRAFT_57202 [Melampsora larici-populina 98AG31]